jgi:PhnB protein
MNQRVNPIPDGYRSAIPMLAYSDAAKAIEFYRKAFGATEVNRLTDDKGKVAHCEMRIGEAQIMIADEYPGENVTPQQLGGAAVIIHLFVEDVDALFARATAEGATILRPLNDQFTGNRNGKLRDPFGYVWLIQTRKEDISAEEMHRRFQDTPES